MLTSSGSVGLPRKSTDAVTRELVNGFICHRFGSTRHRAAGVTICFKSTLGRDKHVRRIWSNFPKKITGRLGAVRLRTKHMDVCATVPYFPVDGGAHESREISSCLVEEINKNCNQLPNRCLPLVLGDVNAHVGKMDGLLIDDMHIGPREVQDTNTNGRALLDICRAQRLAAVNTFVDVGPTFYGTGNNRRSRVDYILVPKPSIISLQK